MGCGGMSDLSGRIARLKRIALLLITLLGAVCSAPGVRAEQSLDQAASDPTASLMSYQLQYFHSPSIYNLPVQSSSRVQFRAAIPYRLGNTNNIFRLTLPYITDTPADASGLSDATVFNLSTFDASWGRWGIGAVALLPTGKDGLSAEKWAIGPAVGFTVQNGNMLWGLFNQNLFTIAGDDTRPDVNISTFQPILNFGLGNGWSTGVSEMTFVYDWEAGEFTSLPLGWKISKLGKWGKVPVQVIGSYEYNFYDSGTGPEQTIGLTFKMLLPKG